MKRIMPGMNMTQLQTNENQGDHNPRPDEGNKHDKTWNMPRSEETINKNTSWKKAFYRRHAATVSMQ